MEGCEYLSTTPDIMINEKEFARIYFQRQKDVAVEQRITRIASV